MRRAIIALCLALACACGPRITAGFVIAKDHEPEREILMFFPLFMSCGKDCFTTIMIPYWVNDDEDWIVTIKAGEHKRSLYVVPALYERAKLGDWFSLDPQVAYAEHNTKRRATDEEARNAS